MLGALIVMVTGRFLGGDNAVLLKRVNSFQMNDNETMRETLITLKTRDVFCVFFLYLINTFLFFY